MGVVTRTPSLSSRRLRSREGRPYFSTRCDAASRLARHRAPSPRSKASCAWLRVKRRPCWSRGAAPSGRRGLTLDISVRRRRKRPKNFSQSQTPTLAGSGAPALAAPPREKRRSKGQTIGEARELLDFKIESHRINAWGAAKRADGRSKGAAEGDIPSLVPFREHCIGPLKKAHRARHVPLEAKTLGSDGVEIAHLCETYRLQAADISLCTLAQGRELRRQRLLPQASLRERIFRYAERVALSRERQGLRPSLLA